jgi:PAS domain S-box-containing protein
LQVSQDFDDENLNPFSSWFFWGFWLAGVLACVFWLWQVRQMHEEDIALLRTFPITILKGDLPTPIEPQLEEHKELAHTLNGLVRPLMELKMFAQDINKENSQASNFKLFGNRGELGKALAQMREGLIKNAEENEIRNIINTGLAKFADIFAKYTNNLSQLSDAFLANLVGYLHANQGGLFLLENQGGLPYLELKASFAYDQKRYMERVVEPGQGLIGQVWKEGETTYMREVPQFYVNITSGLGEATPNALLIVPLKATNAVLGVLEIASFHEILPYQREFVEKVAENLAQVIANSQQAEQTRHLLQESQALAHSLQSREEELKEKMQALQIAQTTMESTKEELEVKENNLQALINNISHAIVAFDRVYRITVINKAMRQLYLEQNVSLELGKNLLEEMPQQEFAKRHKDFFRVLSGEKFVTLERVEKNRQTLYYELHYNPILNEEKDVLGASIFIENITQQKMAEVYLKETEANLNSLINNTKDAIMALDKDCNILVVNDAYMRQFAEKGYKLQQGRSLFDYLSGEKQTEWREYCRRALAGEHFLKVTDTGKFPDKTYIEHWFNPIREDGEVVGLSVFARDITETRRTEIQNKETLLESLEESEKLKQANRNLELQITEYQRRIEDLQSLPR